jgi:hypothetical protein
VEPDLGEVQRVARATCTQLHDEAIAAGFKVRRDRDPGSYNSRRVYPIIYAALATGLLEVRSG